MTDDRHDEPPAMSESSNPVRRGDRDRPAAESVMPVILILDNLRSAFNIGNIFRLAEAVRVTEIIGCGYSAMPPHEKLAKTARGCDRLVRSRRLPTAAEAVVAVRQEGFRVLAVETVPGTVSIWDWQAAFPLALVFGNEALGISEDALAVCDGAVNLPCYGRKNSINVGNCAAVALYEARRQWNELSNDMPVALL